MLDYAIGALMIAAPWLFGFAENRSTDQNTGYGSETWVFVILGIAVWIYSVLTDYELGAWKNISMKSHLTIDTISAIFLVLSPWILGFSHIVYLPHLIFGIAELCIIFLTDPRPYHTHHSSDYARG